MALRKQSKQFAPSTPFAELNEVTNRVNTVNWANFFLSVAVLLLFIGCASVGQKDRVLALVDGDPVTEGDLQYSLTIKNTGRKTFHLPDL